MQIPSRFSVAIHICLCLAFFDEELEIKCNKKHCKKMTSEALADSVGANSVIVRNILIQLKVAGIVNIARGSGGSKLARDPRNISLLDIFHAVQSVNENQLFRFHTNPNELCPLGKNIHSLLEPHFKEAQKALEGYLESITLIDILNNLQID
ncbi:Rrf2 family transcriptional regulator [Helicobacter aurati]|uniref:Rrf2 family transcriptional regulator n=1 Tax=Helicobacter aurati TaxID=137778 RepID=A0A3D8IZ45_9HELI|nr:Rrf2 family transcriptional regulator [Helicobacter aurati]RDU69831.1 Rrf2 family transcriptional regulator [Helicobacter aurati]